MPKDNTTKTEIWRLPDGRSFVVNADYYLASCDKCGWIGSSEECGSDPDTGQGDSEVYCPKCHCSGADCGTQAETAARVPADAADQESASATASPLVFHEGEPPRRSDKQYVALAIDLHGRGFNQPSREPRWCIVRWGNSALSDRDPYWEWSVPGRTTVVEVLSWAELPSLDGIGQRALESANA